MMTMRKRCKSPVFSLTTWCNQINEPYSVFRHARDVLSGYCFLLNSILFLFSWFLLPGIGSTEFFCVKYDSIPCRMRSWKSLVLQLQWLFLKWKTYLSTGCNSYIGEYAICAISFSISEFNSRFSFYQCSCCFCWPFSFFLSSSVLFLQFLFFFYFLNPSYTSFNNILLNLYFFFFLVLLRYFVRWEVRRRRAALTWGTASRNW